MYKDKDKQRETQKERQRRYRRDKQGVTDSERDEAIDFMAKTAGKAERAEPKRGKDIKCITIGDQARSIKTMAMLHSDACKGSTLKQPSPLETVDSFASDGVVMGFTDLPNTETIPPVEQVRYKLPDIAVKPYQMTVMERLFYRPANKLGRGETNFVSLPGRACYNMFKRKARG